MRLNKYLSETGICSRRQADQWISQSRVLINGQAVALGSQVGEGDVVEVDGQRVEPRQAHVYLALHKPVGITCSGVATP